MQVLCSKQSSKKSDSRVRASSIYELKALVKLAKERGYSLASFMSNQHITNLDMMLLDSAIKGLSLDKADETLLILEDQYINMLHKLIWILIETLK